MRLVSGAGGGARRGRPRDPSRDEAILNATLDLLSEVPYDDVTVRSIARRAGVGLATIYRRWPTKEGLVLDALRTATPVPEEFLADDTDPRDALVALLRAFARSLQGPRGALILNLLGQARGDANLAEILQSIVQARLAAAAHHLARLPGISAARVDLAATMLPATVLFRCAVLGQRLNARDVTRLVDATLDAWKE